MKYIVQPYDQAVHGSLELLCKQTQENVQMLPLYPEKIAEQYGRFVIAIDQVAIGYCAQTAAYPGSIVEIGSLIIGAEHRGRGLSVSLCAATTSAAIEEGKTPIAFCNSISERVFSKVGYTPMKPCEIPSESMGLCKECPKQPANGGCCDRVYVYNGGQDE